jgi:hypothetical protein
VGKELQKVTAMKRYAMKSLQKSNGDEALNDDFP